MPISVDLLVFDLDGTLIDSRADIALATNLMLKELGLDEIDLHAVVTFIGEGVRTLIERALRKTSPATVWNDSDIDHAVAVFRNHYADHLMDSTTMYPHVVETLQAFGQKRKAVLSNKPYEFSNRILELLGIRDSFEVVLGGDSLAKRKPEPEPLWHLLDHFQTTRDRSVMIGDSRTDIDCGTAAGVLTCGVSYGFRPRIELENARATVIIDDLFELKEKFC